MEPSDKGGIETFRQAIHQLLALLYNTVNCYINSFLCNEKENGPPTVGGPFRFVTYFAARLCSAHPPTPSASKQANSAYAQQG
jgi:hypothetical protein